jgi:transmembrane sensor
VGTSFAVRNIDAHPPEVLVQEGIVDVGRQTEKAPIRVGANMRVVASGAAGPALHVASVDPAAVSRELAWRQGMLSFEDVSLASAAEEFARYSDAHIAIPDPQLRSVTITGVFSASNPLGFAHAAASSLGLKISAEGGKIELRRP